MNKPRVLVAHPWLRPSGGGNLVAAWTLEALCTDCEVSLAALEPVDYREVNRNFGTSLRDGDFTVHVAPRFHQTILRNMPTPSALLDMCLTMRWAQDLDHRGHYDVLFGTQNEIDFHRRGIQYVHYPWLYLPRPVAEVRWYHRVPGALSLYRKSCMALARATPEGLRRNLTLANSEFVAGRIDDVYGIRARVIYPPAPGKYAERPWDRRRLAVAAVGRIHPGKRWDMAVEIVERVRRRGHDLALTLIGHSDDLAYTARLEAMSATRPWFRLLRDVDRNQLLAELAQHRYGIHPMEEEHFGIAPAELQRAGCIPFVRNSGGPVEIVGGDRRLTFDGVEEAAQKIARVVEDPALERELVSQVAERRDWFSTERFCQSVREIVAQFAREAAERKTELRPAGSVTA
jgi:glycosyltransferase involved in cell wall biosynthesis